MTVRYVVIARLRYISRWSW